MSTAVDKKRELAKRNPSKYVIREYMDEVTRCEAGFESMDRALANAAHRLLRDIGMSEAYAVESTSMVADRVSVRFARLWAECLFEEMVETTSTVPTVRPGS